MRTPVVPTKLEAANGRRRRRRRAQPELEQRNFELRAMTHVQTTRSVACTTVSKQQRPSTPQRHRKKVQLSSISNRQGAIVGILYSSTLVLLVEQAYQLSVIKNTAPLGKPNSLSFGLEYIADSAYNQEPANTEQHSRRAQV